MPKQRLNETTETNRLKKDIKAYDPCAFVHKVHGGTYGAGLPDLMIIHEGQTYWLEMKVGSNKPTDRQYATMVNMMKAGARVAILTVTKQDDVWWIRCEEPMFLMDEDSPIGTDFVRNRRRGQKWQVGGIFDWMNNNAFERDNAPGSAAP